MAFSSKGFTRQADEKSDELIRLLAMASHYGQYPVVFDTSPCSQRIQAQAEKELGIHIYDISEFLLKFVLPRLKFTHKELSVAVHVPCSLRKVNGQGALVNLARMCAEKVFLSESVPCCGFAGDRGFLNPELPASALVSLKPSLPYDCHAGYSTSRTCEIGVSLHTGINYQSIAYLLDDVTEAL